LAINVGGCVKSNYLIILLSCIFFTSYAVHDENLDLVLELNSKEFKISDQTFYFWSESVWSEYMKTEYTYSDGLLETATSYAWSSSSFTWTPNNRTQYYYSDGKIVLWTTQVYNETIWVNQHKCEYMYDQDAISFTYIYSWSDPEWAVQSRYVYTYMDEFNYIMTGQYPDGSEWNNSYRIIYEKDSAGNIIDYIYQRYEEAEWVSNQRIIYNYTQGKLRDLHYVSMERNQSGKT
jgi:hypothetical protein